MTLTTKEDCLNHLEENYHTYNSPVAYLGVHKLYRFYNKILTQREIKRFLATSESYTQLSPERRSKVFEETLAFSPNDVIQFDLVDVSEMKKENNNFCFLICAIDCYSRVAHVLPLLTKHSKQVALSMSAIVHRYGVRPRIISMDRYYFIFLL